MVQSAENRTVNGRRVCVMKRYEPFFAKDDLTHHTVYTTLFIYAYFLINNIVTIAADRTIFT